MGTGPLWSFSLLLEHFKISKPIYFSNFPEHVKDLIHNTWWFTCVPVLYYISFIYSVMKTV